jgi:muramoyltetrapeptide carboxypeptidase
MADRFATREFMRLKGKTAAVIAPAGIPDMANIARGVALLESWGLRVLMGEHVADRFRYFAGTLEHRSADLSWALSDPSIDIVWIARGGYGCAQALASVPAGVPCHKTIVGFSDATALFSMLKPMPNVRLIHGPTLNSLAAKVNDQSRDSVLAALLDSTPAPIALRRLYGADAPVEGILDGGNITVLASLAGTNWQARFDGAIVLLEDVTEPAYRIDRSITQLKASGSFDGARAFVFGEFIRCALPVGADFTLHDMLVDLLRSFNVPILTGLPIGHGVTNVAWTYGSRASIRADALLFRAP